MLLDWLGDLGGLLDALFVICGVIVAPVENFSLKMHIMSSLFTKQSKSGGDGLNLSESAKSNKVLDSKSLLET